jgi:parallel beta-helix repeat protein
VGEIPVTFILLGDFLSKLSCTLLVLALLLVSAGVAGAELIYVEPGSSIQAAVNNSTSGDFVLVKAGSYEENIVINISGVTVTSEPENPEGVFIRARDANSSVFQVQADNVTIIGFNISGSGEFFITSEASSSRNSNSSGDSGLQSVTEGLIAAQDYGSGSGEVFVSRSNEFGCPPAGICLDRVENCTLERNYIFENQYGVYVQGSTNSILSNNTFFRNGILFDEGCSKNMAVNNSILEGNFILSSHCWDNVISQNRLSNGGGIGIACCGGGNLVSANEVINCSTGIDIYDTQARTVLSDNRIEACDYGIYLILVYGSRVYNNTILDSNRGIFLRENSQSNELLNNTIVSSGESGIYLLDYSSDNRIYNNYLNNSVNVEAKNSEGNIWNTTKSPGTNIMEGPYMGGNFWADLNGTGFSQTAEDSDSDGISDQPYKVYGSDFDYLPLSKPPALVRTNLRIIIEKSMEVALNVPANYSESGLKRGLLFLWF